MNDDDHNAFEFRFPRNRDSMPSDRASASSIMRLGVALPDNDVQEACQPLNMPGDD